MPQYQGLVLTAKSDVKVAKLTSQETTLQLSDIQKYLKKKSGVSLLGKYSLKGTTLYLFGCKDGKAGTENKHELPPPLDTDLYFGDIVLIASKHSNSYSIPIPFTSQEYENFYTKMFEGFEDVDSENDEDDEDDQLEGDVEEDLELEVDNLEEEVEEEEVEEEEEEVEEEGGVEIEGEVEKEVVEVEIPKLRVLPKEKKVEKKSAKKPAKSAQLLQLFPDLSNEPELEFEQESKVPPTHPLRLKMYELIQTLFEKYLTSADFIKLEHNLFNSSLTISERRHITKSWQHPIFVEIYKGNCRSVISNFHPEQYTQNNTVMERFKQGKVSLEDISQMSFNDLNPDIWKDLSFRQFEREKRQLEGNKAMATDQFRCHRCGKKECTYYELQTRSADEPMTVFIQCVNCGKHWRQ